MKRTLFLEEIARQLDIQPICAILGPRQVGKTTLARQYIEDYLKKPAVFFDLENELDLARLDNPMIALSSVKESFIVIDEIQFRPELFPVLRVLVDQPKNKKKFLILGSASRDLIRQSSETLAGRIGYIELPPFCLFETHMSSQLWLRGGFPRSYLAKSDRASYAWRRNYIRMFLERDIPSLGFGVPPQQLRRFWMMLAHYHGQTLNLSEIARSLMVSDMTVRRYLDILVGTFMVRTLQPWFENISKRQVRAPKLYINDSGILNTLLTIQNETALHTNPKLAALWEGFALEQTIQFLGIVPEEAFFWATQAEAELDLFVMLGGKRFGFEFKYADVPRTTKSMHVAIESLKLDHLFIIYPQEPVFVVDKKITACGLNALARGELSDVLPSAQ